ncbi:pentatricopeptide repeat protein [Aspergillus clavatus NRRL 1]|uniref:Pentatricopeptide repeat protein n=1 Tax=Aspergillus clavatus (strain ATCC 1007 / CBS 513.65 / DSM 816 / NCTC 3887 / NRRL 1 / QM 1276 / 107) TaxID=344612 RepID=A1C6N6_ASPCL|nr:pentatricopeptide repeat protein [Aspergillus clavatus NRRL 1]EAW14057.1 pentatricopeptide repeat protein [Aspergillus clavatus NRRL 1]
MDSGFVSVHHSVPVVDERKWPARPENYDISLTEPTKDLQNSHLLKKSSKLREDANTSPTFSDILSAPPGVPKNLEDRSTSELETRLQELATGSPKILSASQILRILIRDRHVRPEVRHYRALILANSDAERGSPDVVRKLLVEMEENGIPADSGTLHAALQALAVHPDYLLRQDILRALRDRWLPLSPAGWHYVVAGLLRENQFELALDHLANMERKEIVIEDWLHGLLIYNLCEIGDFDEVLEQIRKRTSQGHDMTSDLWLYVLDTASAASHIETVQYIWTQRVQLGYLNPSKVLSRNTLTVTGRMGDPQLASFVIRYLSDSGVALVLHDYEKAVEAYAKAGKLSAAFEILCKMHKAGIKLERSSTRAIYNYMVLTKTSPRQAWTILKTLKSLKYTIPMECAHVVIELCDHESFDDPFAVDEGIAFYQELYTLCPGKADLSIYNTLIGMARRAKNIQAGMFAVKEMSSFGVVPNDTTFEHLVMMCLDAGNFESAYMYFQDLVARGFRPRGYMRRKIIEICSASDDPFALQLRNHPRVQDTGDRDQADNTKSELEHSVAILKIASEAPPRHADRHLHWMQGLPSKIERRAANKERRKRKRRRLAMERAQEEDDWMDYEPGGLVPEDQMKADPTLNN